MRISDLSSDVCSSDLIDQQYILGPYLSGGGYSTNNPIFDSQGSRPFGNTTIIDVRGVSGSIVYDFSPSVSIKSVTAYRTLDAFWTSNSDHTPNPGIDTDRKSTRLNSSH